MNSNKITFSSIIGKRPKGLVFSVTFLFLLASMGIASFSENAASAKSAASAERRKLAAMPANPFKSWKSLQSFPAKLDAFIADNFGFRLKLIHSANQISYSIFGDMPTDRYFRGLQGWFFRGEGDSDSGNDLKDMLGQTPLSSEQVDNWINKIKSNNDYFRKSGAKYYFAIAPRKASVYPEFLPTAIRESLGKSRLEQISFEAERQIPEVWVNLRKALVDKKNNEIFPNLYFQTDAHLNYVGAYFGYRTFLDRFEIGSPVSSKDYVLHQDKNWIHSGFQSETGLTISEPYPSFFPLETTAYKNINGIKPKRGEVLEGQEDVVTGSAVSFTKAGIGNFAMPSTQVKLLDGEISSRCRRMTQRNVSAENKRVILLLGDSFLEKMAPFFAAHAEYTYFCRQILTFNPPIFDAGLKTQIKPDLVVQSFVESFLLRKHD